MSLTVPAAHLARGWLAVAVASSADEERPQLHHAVYVEQFADKGLRLTATDSYMLLTTWVPDVDHTDEAEPGPEEEPLITAVAQDPYRRARKLLTHLLKLARAEEVHNAKALDVMVALNVPFTEEAREGSPMRLEGFAGRAVTIDYPDNERVQLGVYDGPWHDYRAMLLGYRHQRPMRMAISQRIAAGLGKSASVFGPETVIYQRFGGQDKPMVVTDGAEPLVTGLVMPTKWDFDRDKPWGEVDADNVVAGAEAMLADPDDDEPE